MAITSALSHEQDTVLNNLMQSLRQLPKERWKEVQTFIDFLAYQGSSTANDFIGLDALDILSITDLIQMAKSSTPTDKSQRLQELLSVQKERLLAPDEEQEAAGLVEQEDLYTLRKAKAIHILKQRNALPQDLRKFLA